jgi:hypothetical protein
MKKKLPKGDAIALPRTIGRLTKEAGVTVETVRFYEDGTAIPSRKDLGLMDRSDECEEKVGQTSRGQC